MVKTERKTELGVALLLGMKNLLDGDLEEPCNFEGERQAGVILPVFDGDDGLPADVHSLRQPLLRQATLLS